ncbi:MAG: deoxyribonuclease IV [Coriobacteriia bacterium]|nr:deoxyribonuclease IV [Coriobacteriia bacterium]
MLIGAHVGVAGGYDTAVAYAASVGCECLQIFAKSPRQWAARPLRAEVAGAFRDAIRVHAMGPVRVHTAYLINLGSDDDILWEKSWTALADEMARAAALGADAVVTHLGTVHRSHPARTPQRIASAIDLALAHAPADGPRLLLENTAAAGSTFGDGPGELGAVLEMLDLSAGRVGVCLDTCHAHAAGYDMSRGDVWRSLIEEFEQCCAMPIEAIHANDCAFPAGEHRDRHAWIGDGTIGYAGFAAMFDQPALTGIPVIIEMPGDVPVKDAENITRLKRLRDACAELASPGA